MSDWIFTFICFKKTCFTRAFWAVEFYWIWGSPQSEIHCIWDLPHSDYALSRWAPPELSSFLLVQKISEKPGSKDNGLHSSWFKVNPCFFKTIFPFNISHMLRMHRSGSHHFFLVYCMCTGAVCILLLAPSLSYKLYAIKSHAIRPFVEYFVQWAVISASCNCGLSGVWVNCF